MRNLNFIICSFFLNSCSFGYKKTTTYEKTKANDKVKSESIQSAVDSSNWAFYDNPKFTDIDNQYLLLPEAPSGYEWVPNEAFTDEFNGAVLDENKWYSKSPYWTNGRPPATFKAKNVHVADGCLQITNTVLNPTEDADGKPGNKYRIAGGAVASKANNALYGYYSCRMKASSTSMSSTFWMKNLNRDTVYMIDGKMRHCKVRHELDIQETVGAPKKVPGESGMDWVLSVNKRMGSNTHFNVSCDDYNKKVNGKKVSLNVGVGANKTDIAPTNEVYHVYGCWRVNANEIRFYLDGKYVYTIYPSTKYDDTPFGREMYMHMVTETYDWSYAPTPEELKDPKKATTYYDWVRSYKLVKK